MRVSHQAHLNYAKQNRETCLTPLLLKYQGWSSLTCWISHTRRQWRKLNASVWQTPGDYGTVNGYTFVAEAACRIGARELLGQRRLYTKWVTSDGVSGKFAVSFRRILHGKDQRQKQLFGDSVYDVLTSAGFVDEA